MARLELPKRIDAPPAAVFAYVDAHENYHWMFRTPRLTWTTPRHELGAKLQMEMRLGGVPVMVESVTTEVVPGAKLAGVLAAGLVGAWEWRFEAEGDGTRLTLITDYELPIGVLGKLVDRVIVERGLRSDLEWALDEIKRTVESHSQAA